MHITTGATLRSLRVGEHGARGAPALVYNVYTLNWEVGLFGEDRIGIVIGVTLRILKFRVSQKMYPQDLPV